MRRLPPSSSRTADAVGVRTAAGEELPGPAIVSAAGARDTVLRLLPGLVEAKSWADEVALIAQTTDETRHQTIVQHLLASKHQ